MPRKTFVPQFDSLDSIISLSALAHKPRHAPRHGHAHVRPHVERVHSTNHPSRTGTRLAGEITLANGPRADAITVTIFGAGTITVSGTKYPSTGVAIQYDPTTQRGTMSFINDSGTITADVVMLADGSAGQYTITDATGDFAGAKGTGLMYVRDGIVAINPHSQQV